MSTSVAVRGGTWFCDCLEPCSCYQSLKNLGGEVLLQPAIPSLPREIIEDIEKQFFPHWFDSCHLPIIQKPDWLISLWENCAS